MCLQIGLSATYRNMTGLSGADWFFYALYQLVESIVKRKRNEKEVIHMMKIFDDAEIISSYALDDAIADGVLVEIFKNRWNQLSGGKPIVATAHLFGEVSLAALLEIWNEFVNWRKNIMPGLPEEDRLFHTTMNGNTIWVIEDGAAFTLMYPEDY
jgi:hypothetical protein